ncbi:MAG TPA: hypothetical protein VNT30_09320 [Stellaceae bacterium]|nr:hypothetical protein [Stellaceae bacterium]
MTGQRLDLRWKPPGPVAARFMAATARLQVLNGPIGSGKTTTVLMKVIQIASRQAVSRHTGRRRVKVCVVRDTYRQLWKTTLPSWFKRVPRNVGTFTGAENAPASHLVTFQLGDGTMVELQMDFIAIGENAVEDVLRGYEPTFFYLNEGDLLAREVYTYARGRTGRFPDMAECGPTWHGILMDCNAPEFGNWLYEDVFKATPEGVALFRQPSGLAIDAENLDNLPPGYYADQVANQPEWYVRRMIMNEPGYSRAGKPIYPEYSDLRHVSGYELRPVLGMPLGIGLDAGLSPAAALGQRMANGQWRITDELVAEQGTGPTRFGEMLGRLLHERYEGIRTIRGWADPSAAYGADKQAGEKSWIEIVSSVAGIPISPAPTNALIPRLDAVRRPLTRLIDGEPGFLLSPRCTVLREGFNAGYRYRKLHGPGNDRYTDEPDKNEYSHPHDGLQYLVSAGGEDIEIRGRNERRFQLSRDAQRTHEHDWDPFAA